MTFVKIFSPEDKTNCWINLNAVSMIFEEGDSLIVKVNEINAVFVLKDQEAVNLRSYLKDIEVDLNK